MNVDASKIPSHLSPDPGQLPHALIALCAIARFHQIAADPFTLAHQLGLSASDPIGTAEPTDGPVVAHPLQDAVAQEDAAFSYAIAANVFADADSSALRFTAQLASGDPLPGWLHFGQTTVAGAPAWTLSGTPENADVGALQIKVAAMNAAGQSISDEFTLVVENENDAPTVVAPLQSQTASENTAWTFVVPEGTFEDVDAGDVLTYSATWSDGAPLPSWITFNPATRTFTGTPNSCERR